MWKGLPEVLWCSRSGPPGYTPSPGHSADGEGTRQALMEAGARTCASSSNTPGALQGWLLASSLLMGFLLTGEGWLRQALN